jgi:sialate O-acetylesterase
MKSIRAKIEDQNRRIEIKTMLLIKTHKKGEESRMKTLFGFVVGILMAGSLWGDVEFPAIFGDNMVLQRNMSVPVWGWADPGEKVTVEFRGQSSSAVTGEDGKWNLKIPTGKAGGPFEFAARGKNEIKLKNVLVGEVWVCSGQSNMDRNVLFDPLGAEVIKESDKSLIRLFHVPKRSAPLPASDVDAKWNVPSPKDHAAKAFSAVGYFFGLEIYKNLNVPVGLIQASWGGSSSIPWTPPSGFKAVPEMHLYDKVMAFRKKYRDLLKSQMERVKFWASNTEKALAKDAPVTLDFLPTELTRSPGNPPRDYCSLYNRMIAPFVPFAIKGAIWYQGESNRGSGSRYYYNLLALIKGWRQEWGQGDFSFYYVQLAPYKYGGRDRALLACVWEGQRKALNIPNTGMAVINDIGNLKDIHPRNKHDVGKRLALWALAKDYGKDVVYSGPLYKSIKIEGNKARVFFDHADGLKSRDGKDLTFFEIAGKDGKYKEAKAEIDNGSVLVWSDAVSEPVSVRFAWQDIAEPNLVNGVGLPTSAFSSIPSKR